MRRTTIFRSELSAFGALLTFAAGATAQQPPAIQRPIQQAQRAANEASATQNPQVEQPQTDPGRRTVIIGNPSGTIQGQTPSTHVVQQGETLWALAQQYLGDPMLWPELYRLNTDVVEDPHWIYPGEELRLTPDAQPARVVGDSTVVVQQQAVTLTPSPDSDRPAPVGSAMLSQGPTIFSTSSNARTRSSIELTTQRAYRPVRAGEYFSSGFLTEGQTLNSGRLVGASSDPGEASALREIAQLFERVVMSPPAGEALQAGDLVLTFRRSEAVGDFGEIVVPTGLIRVIGPAGQGNNLFAGEVQRIYGPIEERQELIKVQPFSSVANVRPVPVSDGVEGRVIRLRERRGVAQIQDVLFIDKGANDGVRPGDILQIYVTRADPERGGQMVQDQARALVVNTRSRTATAVLVELVRGDVGPQSQIRQIRRMPS